MAEQEFEMRFKEFTGGIPPEGYTNYVQSRFTNLTRQECEDATQDAMVEIVRMLRAGKGKEGEQAGYVFKQTKNRAINLYNKNQRFGDVDSLDAEAYEGGAMSFAELVEDRSRAASPERIVEDAETFGAVSDFIGSWDKDGANYRTLDLMSRFDFDEKELKRWLKETGGSPAAYTTAKARMLPLLEEFLGSLDADRFHRLLDECDARRDERRKRHERD